MSPYELEDFYRVYDYLLNLGYDDNTPDFWDKFNDLLQNKGEVKSVDLPDLDINIPN